MYVWILLIQLTFPDQTTEEFTLPVDSKMLCLAHINHGLEYEPKDFGAVSIMVGCVKEPESREG